MISKKTLDSNFDIQGHRGCRGLLPENTIEAFQHALDLRVTTLEMDLVISQDQKVVVSHEPFFNHEISTSPDGALIQEAEEQNHNIYLMNYEKIQKYDVGKRVHPRFLEQKKQKAFKPLFETVIDTAEAYCKKNNITIHYNVEIKSTIEGDGVFHPEVPLFVDLVMDILIKKGIVTRTMIQSFDVRALQYLHQKYPSATTSYLIENNLSPEENIKTLGFYPTIYSPEYPLVNKHLIEYAKQHSMKVIPWTVNTVKEMEKLILMGVDGIITDYPNLIQN